MRYIFFKVIDTLSREVTVDFVLPPPLLPKRGLLYKERKNLRPKRGQCVQTEGHKKYFSWQNMMGNLQHVSITLIIDIIAMIK